MVQHTINLGFDACNSLKELFKPDIYPNIPQYAIRINEDKRQHFFERCAALSLGNNSIDEITANSRCNEDSVEDGPKILRMFNKGNHFRDWIAALLKLYEDRLIYLEASDKIELPGKLKTCEKIITVFSTTDRNIIDTFVYHWHPDGMKMDVQNPNVTNKHLKSDRNSPAATGIDYAFIPDVLKSFLGI